MWKCDKCKGTNVSQGISLFVPMNRWIDWDHVINEQWWQYVDSFWCNDCDDNCDPVNDET